MNQLRSTFFSLMFVSSAVVATACGPQTQPEAGEPAPTTETAPAGLEGGNCNVPGRKYVSRDPEQCLTITWFCPTGQQQFLDDCGCGCQ